MKERNCIFCMIANGEIPSATIYEDANFRAILDLGPATKGHAIILPREHFRDICDADEKTLAEILPVAVKIGTAMKHVLGASGFNLVQNNGTSAGQTVFHLHMHVIPRYEGGQEMITWTPGKADQEEMERTAKMIRGAL